MRYGTVVKFFPGKGFGFIRPDEGPDVFFHLTALGGCEPVPEIREGQAVKFELDAESRRKLIARRRRRKPTDDEPEEDRNRLQAQMVELIPEIPGGKLNDVAYDKSTRPHPRARRKKPTWRR